MKMIPLQYNGSPSSLSRLGRGKLFTILCGSRFFFSYLYPYITAVVNCSTANKRLNCAQSRSKYYSISYANPGNGSTPQPGQTSHRWMVGTHKAWSVCNGGETPAGCLDNPDILFYKGNIGEGTFCYASQDSAPNRGDKRRGWYA